MPYVKITGYLEVADDELDDDGILTAEAYDRYMVDRPTAAISDLEDADVEPDDRP